MRILLVDDDTGVIQSLLAILKTLPGHDLRVATSGEKALENAAALGGVDLLITDVVMEPMNGFDLRDQIVTLYPAARVILITGYDLSDYTEQTQYHQLLAKPIDAETLLDAVARELPTAPEPAPAEVEPIPEAKLPVEAEEAPVPTVETVIPPVAAPEPVVTVAEAPAPHVPETPAEVPVSHQATPEPPVVVPEPLPEAPISVVSFSEPPPPTPEPPAVVSTPSIFAPEPPVEIPAPPVAVSEAPEPVPAPEPVIAPEPMVTLEPASAPESLVAASAPVVVIPESLPDLPVLPAAIPEPAVAVSMPPTAVPEPPAAAPVPAPVVPETPVVIAAPPVVAPAPVAPPPVTAPSVAAMSVAAQQTVKVQPPQVATVSATAVPVAKVAQPTARPTAGPQATPVAQPVRNPQPVVPRAVPASPPNVIPGGAPRPVSPATVRVASTTRIQPIPAPAAPRADVRPQTGAPAVPAPPPSAAVRTVKAVAIPPPMAAPKAARPVFPVPAQPKNPTFPPPKFPSAIAGPPAAVSIAPAPMEPGELAGQTLGAYQLLRKIGNGHWGSIYAGVQVSINRPVALEILDADKATDEAARERFIADARAKAQVQHPAILAVYEAGEADGRFFYAHEFVDGGSLADLKNSGQRLDESTALKVLRVAAEGLAYLTAHHIPHHPPEAASISLGSDGQPHLANLATQLADGQLTPEQEIQALGRIMLSVLPAIQSLSQGLRDLLKGLVQSGPGTLTSWGAVLQGIKAIEPKVVPVEAAKISAQDRAAIAAVELARKQQKRALYISIASVVTLLVLVAGLVYWLFGSNERNLEEQVDIPAGEFLFANGESKTMPEFWIDKYEVTYGQYAKFVQALENHPTSEFDDPRQPAIKTAVMHKPPHWLIYYPNAVAGHPVHETPIDLNCPIMEVDYWDAYAYAKWKGRELPTEEEWEKAARGPKGFKYPWGEDFDPKNVNSGADFDPNDPGGKGKIDGYNFWNPVDKIKGDKSPFGVMGMAGNVEEWTGTWDPEKKRPVIKGGSFMSKDVRLDQRAVVDPNAVSEALGFRTISHSPPPKK